MKNFLLFLLAFILCASTTWQKQGGRRNRKQKDTSEEVLPFPRTFWGDPVTKGNVVPNGTLDPVPVSALESLSDGTVSYLRGSLSTRVIPIVYVLVVSVGVPANVAILGLLATKVRKVSSAILYCSLAVSDLLLLLSLLLKIHYHLHGNHWGLGETACRLVTACFYGNLHCSAATLASIGVKRYLAVVHPFTYKSMPKRRWAAWVSLALWGVFGASMVPELLVQQSFWLPQLNRTSCHDVLPLYHGSHRFLLYYNLLFTAAGLLLPLVVTAACFTRIIGELNRSHHDWSRYIRASSLVLVLFLVCFLPAGLIHLLHLAQLFSDHADRLYVHFSVAVCLCCVHAALDPFLFVLMSTSAGSKLHFMTFKGKSFSISI